MHDLEKVMKMVRVFASGLIGLIIALIVLAVFANVLFGNIGVDPIGHLKELIKVFIGTGASGFTGLLALIVLVTFYYHSKEKH